MENIIRNNVENSIYCRFNNGVDCTDCSEYNCNHCGWNPDVAAERVKEWKNKNGYKD